MNDKHNRTIDYVRLSVTDRCNLRCKYCMPKEAVDYFEEVLSLEEIKKIVDNICSLGIKKIKLTGGEPLVRSDIVEIVKYIKSKDTIKSLTITTNGVYLDKYIDEFIKLKVDGINISVDTIDRSMYLEFTRRDQLNKVLENIDLALNKGFKNIKLNAVPMIEQPIDNLFNLIEYAQEKNLILRFIEMMPIGLGRKYKSYNSLELKEQLTKRYGQIKELEENYGNGPASYFTFENLKMPIGIIAAISNKFCESCNRIRITSDGKLKQCLHYNYHVDFKNIQKEDLDNIKDFIYEKPKEHSFNKKTNKKLEELNMSSIGG